MNEQKALYDSVKLLVRERLRLNGKDQFLDLYQNTRSLRLGDGPEHEKTELSSLPDSDRRTELGRGQSIRLP